MIHLFKKTFLFYLFFIPYVSLADEKTLPIKYDPIINVSSIFKIIFVLILILILIYSIFWILKKKYFLQSTVKSGNQIRIISSISVGPREKIFMIEVADKQFLLSSTSTNINLIKSFDEKILECEGEFKNNTFSHILSKYRSNF